MKRIHERVKLGGLTLLVIGLLFRPTPSPGGAMSPALESAALAQTGPCGCMDIVLVVDTTGSMGGAIGNVVAGLGNIIAAAQTASGGDLRMGLVTFKDFALVNQPLTATIADVTAEVNVLTATGGSGEPESSDDALRYVVTGASNCGAVQDEGPLGLFRDGCVKIAVLITDARPAGCDDSGAVSKSRSERETAGFRPAVGSAST